MSGMRVEVETLTSRRSGLETQLADVVKRWGIEKNRALQAVSDSADAVGRALRDWVREHDGEVARFRAALVAMRVEDLKAAIEGIGEATKYALHTVEKEVHAV